MSSRPGNSDGLVLPSAWRSYEQAVILLTVQGVPMLLRPAAAGTVQGAFSYQAPVHVVTAWNPRGKRLSHEENRRREQALRADPALIGLEVHGCAGGDLGGAHQEPSLMIEGLSTDVALALGLRHGQDAIFRWTATTFDLLACVGGACTARGWSLEHDHPADRAASDGSCAGRSPARDERDDT